jgi:hypothetical protein
VKEPFVYRAWKWAIQQLTGRRSGDQLERLDTVDWDLLVILDVCRADVLRSVAEWPVPAATSPASCTPEWLRCVADARIFEDAHIVTANPQYDDVNLGAAAVESYWESHWDDARQTVLPEPVLDRVDDLLADGTRRIVAHLQQPHWPYVAMLDGSYTSPAKTSARGTPRDRTTRSSRSRLPRPEAGSTPRAPRWPTGRRSTASGTPSNPTSLRGWTALTESS